MISREIVIGISAIVFLASCDDEDHADINGGGPGSSDSNAVATDSTGGFCNPVGGTQNLGTPSWTSGMVTANIDFDGNPDAQGVVGRMAADQVGNDPLGQDIEHL